MLSLPCALRSKLAKHTAKQKGVTWEEVIPGVQVTETCSVLWRASGMVGTQLHGWFSNQRRFPICNGSTYDFSTLRQCGSCILGRNRIWNLGLGSLPQASGLWYHPLMRLDSSGGHDSPSDARSQRSTTNMLVATLNPQSHAVPHLPHSVSK